LGSVGRRAGVGVVVAGAAVSGRIVVRESSAASATSSTATGTGVARLAPLRDLGFVAGLGDFDVDFAAVDASLVQEIDSLSGLFFRLELDESVSERARAASDDVRGDDSAGGREFCGQFVGLGLEGQITNKHFGVHFRGKD